MPTATVFRNWSTICAEPSNELKFLAATTKDSVTLDRLKVLCLEYFSDNEHPLRIPASVLLKLNMVMHPLSDFFNSNNVSHEALTACVMLSETAEKLGIPTVKVYLDADNSWPDGSDEETHFVPRAVYNDLNRQLVGQKFQLGMRVTYLDKPYYVLFFVESNAKDYGKKIVASKRVSQDQDLMILAPDEYIDISS
ncbi:TPA: hypothetical protein DCQ44_01205 [Candidatus Taylorbacteria bacterium]|nr:hypothetical protein [Candidatus Taylorbacteria bacterium]